MKKQSKKKKGRKRVQSTYQKARRNHKDTVFRMLFNDPKELLSLYNGVNGSSYTKTEDLVITTLENAIYLNMKNDISFVLDNTLSLYEHQSSVNPNMPLRMLEYVTDMLRGLTRGEDIYGNKQILIPTPRFVVFYNGTQDQPDKIEYRLSSSFEKPVEQPELELIVTVYNINKGKNQELFSRCQTLRDYADFVAMVRENLVNMVPDEAIAVAVDECIRRDILKDFLLKNKTEVIAVSIYEYDEEAHMETIRAEEREKTEQEKARADRAEALAEQERLRADQEKLRADQAEALINKEKYRADQEKLRVNQAEERIRELESMLAKLTHLVVQEDI